MKKQFFLINIFFLLIFMSCEFSPAYSKKPDSYFFNKMEPLEWSEDYVLAATLYPQQIQVWNSKTNKLVHKYSLHTDESKWGKGTERALDVRDMAVLNGVIWFIGLGLQRSLIRLDCKTGEMRYIELDMKPSGVVAIPEGNSGNGMIVTSTYADSRIGVAVRFLDTEGNIIKKSNISFDKIKLLSIGECYYENENYYTVAVKDESYSKDKDIDFKLINLSDSQKKYLYDIEPQKIFHTNFIKDNFDEDLENYFCNSRLITFSSNSEQRFMEINVWNDDYYENPSSKYLFIRFLYKINSFENFDIQYTGIKYAEEDSKTFFSAYEYGENIYVTGKQLHEVETKEYLEGLETTIYPKTGGNQIKHIQMPYGNQIYCEMKEDCTWFSKNIYFQDKKTLEWNKSQEAAIYKLDYKNQTVYEYDKDGNCKELTWIEG